MRTAALGRTGLGDAAQDLNDQRTVALLVAAVFAYGSARGTDAARGSVYLSFLQTFWTDNSYRAKRYAAANGQPAAALAAVPNTLTVNGFLDSHTLTVIVFSLIAYFGTPSAPAVTAPPSSAMAVSLWFNTKVAALAPPTDRAWTLWNNTRTTSMTNLVDAIMAQATAFFAPTPADPQPTTTTPADPPAPVPGGLPTVPHLHVNLAPETIIGQVPKVPTWIKLLGGAVLVGAVVGVGWYVVKKRPDLFRSRAKGR